MKQTLAQRLLDDSAYWIMISFLTVVYLTGGSTRSDTQALFFLRPLAVLFFGVALWRIDRERMADGKVHLIICAAIVGVMLLYLIPLPLSLWGALPGRSLIVEVDRIALAQDVARGAAINALGAVDTLLALLVPVTALLLMLQLSHEQRSRILLAVILFGLFSGVVGLMQSISGPESSLYFYRITSRNSAVGMFANRNHQAVLLAMLFPMLAAYAALKLRSRFPSRFPQWFAISAGALLIPLILVNGSRAGLLTSIFGLTVGLWLYWQNQLPKDGKMNHANGRLQFVIIAVATFALSAATWQMSRAEAVQRLFGDDRSESRAAFWQPIFEMASALFPVGTGPGGFVQAFIMVEPTGLLDSTYLNQAHNDWLEFYATFGAFSIPLMIGVLCMVGIAAYRATMGRPGSRRVLSLMGISVILVAFLGSIGDYPLRTPFLAAVIAMATVWAWAPGERGAKIRQDDPKVVD